MSISEFLGVTVAQEYVFMRNRMIHTYVDDIGVCNFSSDLLLL